MYESSYRILSDELILGVSGAGHKRLKRLKRHKRDPKKPKTQKTFRFWPKHLLIFTQKPLDFDPKHL